MSSDKKVKIMIVDDQQIMLDGLETLLTIRSEFEVIGLVQSGEEAIELLTSNTPDLILMDIRMPGMGGVLATKVIKDAYPAIIILILTTFDDDSYIIEALSNGASGYLLKDINGERLISSIYEALSGHLLLTGRVAQKLALNIKGNGYLTGGNLDAVSEKLAFTIREKEISKLLMDGLSSKEIAKKLHLTQGTVKNYLSNIYGKIGTNDRAKAMLILKRLKAQEH